MNKEKRELLSNFTVGELLEDQRVYNGIQYAMQRYDNIENRFILDIVKLGQNN